MRFRPPIWEGGIHTATATNFCCFFLLNSLSVNTPCSLKLASF